MKIVFMAPFGIRPKGTLIARMLPLADALQREGHTVTMVAPPYTNPEDSGITETVRGVRLVNVRLPQMGRAAGALPLAFRMFRAALAEKPDIVHLFKPKGYGGLAAMLLLMLHRCGIRMPRLFVDCDDHEGDEGMNALHDYSLAEKFLYRFQEQWIPRQAAGVTAASRELMSLLTLAGLPPAAIQYLPNCAVAGEGGSGALVRTRFAIPKDAPLLILYSRFFEFTQQRLHQIVAGIFREMPEVRMLVVGEGRNGEEQLLLQAAQSMGFADALIMAGWVEPEEIPDYLAAADVALYLMDETPVNRAKCPAKLVEIIAAGVAVVADAVGQVPEYTGGGRFALLSDPDRPDSIIESAVRLLRNREERGRFSADARRYLAENFNWESSSQELIAFYRRNISE